MEILMTTKQTKILMFLAAIIVALLFLLLSGCAAIYPDIDHEGNNCEYYGVSEDNVRMFKSKTIYSENNMPVVREGSYKEVSKFCETENSRYIVWGCARYDEKDGQYVAITTTFSPYVRRHEQCHLILGPYHEPKTVFFKSKSCWRPY